MFDPWNVSKPKSSHLLLYARQLHAYAHAIENPAPRSFGGYPIARLGLLVFEPDKFLHREISMAALEGALKWVDIQRDDEAFREFLREVVQVLAHDQPPQPSLMCEWCAHREACRHTGW